jgi:peroxiredoxin Q/BCP
MLSSWASTWLASDLLEGSVAPNGPTSLMTETLRRRRLLEISFQALTCSAAVWIAPLRASALGGTLPSLQESAPGFRLDGVEPDPGGTARPVTLGLDDCRGSWLVLYFYPRDFTSGCTLEARGFQRDLPRFEAAGTRVIGISADDPEQHAEFCGSEGLRYTLLSDPGGLVSQRYGSWIPPYSQRHTFLIDPQGVLRASWVAVRPAGHSQEVLAELQRLQASA